MSYALMSAGGKDATLALDRARRRGLDVRYLVTLHDESSMRVRYQGVRTRLIVNQARTLGLELLAAPTTEHTFEPVFIDMLRTLRAKDVTGVIFGNVHLPDVRAWYEDRVRAAGLEHVEPLWGDPSVEIAWEVVERGYRALVVSVHLQEHATGLLGREFDADLVTEISCTDDVDPCGERGEYHTFVFDGPELQYPVGFTRGRTLDEHGHRYLDLLPLNGELDPTTNELP
jgi:uncharacterized protein (TIGR00290 family)